MIRLYIIEDHRNMVVSSFRNFFRGSRDGINVAGSSAGIDEAVANVDPDSFDVFILDLWLSGADPVQNIRTLKVKFPDKPIIIFTSENEPFWKQTMMVEGAMAYITKDAATADIRNAIKKVAAGESVFPALLDQKDKEDLGVLLEHKKEELTLTQKEILAMLKDGSKHKDISKVLFISISTIEKTLNMLRIRYNVKNNIELVQHLIAMGVI
jgi:DNA-binding NarL/FixJ family response regulator